MKYFVIIRQAFHVFDVVRYVFLMFSKCCNVIVFSVFFVRGGRFVKQVVRDFFQNG